MGCFNCNPATPSMMVSPQPVKATHAMRETQETVVNGNDGKQYALNQPLVPAAHFPRTQCSAELTIKGIPRRIDKPTCIEVFNEAMRLMELNGEPYWFVNLWLNLNLQWVTRVAPKYQLITVAQLEAISRPI